jgi:hypothetical protein
MPTETTFIGYESQKPDPRWYKVITPLSALALVLVLIWVLRPSLSHSGPTPRGESAAHLMQIGEMCLLYANENQDRLPDNLGILTTTEDMAPESLQSPLGSQYATSPPSTQPAVLIPWANQHCDYTYLGAGKLASQLTPKDILGHEKWSIAKQHNGMNILFGDEHVEWFTLADAAKILAQKPSTAPTP